MIRFEEGKDYGFGRCCRRTEKTVTLGTYGRLKIKIKDDCEYVSYTVNGQGINACFADCREQKGRCKI